MNDAVRLAIVDPPEPMPGVLGIVIPETRLEESRNLERERKRQLWKVRGVVSDHIPLAGDIKSIVNRERTHNFSLNSPSLTLYLHRGGNDAIFFDLVAFPNKRLDYIEVRVDTDLPSEAFSLARQPLNELLDAFVRTPPNPPLVLQRLELVSPTDGGILAYELTLPFNNGLSFGPMGGIIQWPVFAPYFAIFREAITTSSPFYRLLCAWRVFEGIQTIRKWLREQCTRFKIDARLPKETEIDIEHLQRMGFRFDFCGRIKKLSDLFNELRELRNGVAHFLFEGEIGNEHVLLGRSSEVRNYSLSSAILLSYVAREIDALRIFYVKYVEPHMMRVSILPMETQKDQFVVKGSFRYDFRVVSSRIIIKRDGQIIGRSFSTLEKDTKESQSPFHGFLKAIGLSEVDAHMICEIVQRGENVSGVVGRR